MPSLSNKLKSLGVQVGTTKIQKPAPQPEHPLEQVVVNGYFLETPYGRVFQVEERFPAFHQLGHTPLLGDAPLDMLAVWAASPQVAEMPPGDFAFLDTETSGLSIGAGTFVTWITVGRFEGDVFRVVQYFLHDPFEETAFLAAFEAFLAPCKAIVTYNGKSFDAPLINNRFRINRWPSPLNDLAHIDLVHLARRLWRDRLPDRRLGTLEDRILGLVRDNNVDVPGYMVPEIYNEYLHTGRVDRLPGVFYHNKFDVLALSALMYHMAGMLADPMGAVEDDLDLLAIGKLYEGLGYMDGAAEIYRDCMQRDLDGKVRADALKRLSFIYKRRGDLQAAMDLWREAAGAGAVYACVELAKACEHKLREIRKALEWTQTALEIVSASNFPFSEQLQWKGDLEHRLARLERKRGNEPGF